MSFLEGQLANVLEKAFEKEIFLPDNLIPVDVLPEGAQDMARKFRMTQLRMQRGWLYGGWSQLADGSYMPYDAPAVWAPTQPGDETSDDEASDDDSLDMRDQLSVPEPPNSL